MGAQRDPCLSKTAAWIGVDWGTTNLRLWIIDHNDRIVAEHSSEKGMSRLSSQEFEPTLLDIISEYLPDGEKTDIVICGMAGARQGWHEAPYVGVPARPSALKFVTVPTKDPRLHVSILPGLKVEHPADVMRGEETQIAGFLADVPEFDGILALPGTHTKWVRIQNGLVVTFKTIMTGELFSLLTNSSILKHSVQSGWDWSEFEGAVNVAFKNPGDVTAHLFSLRAENLLQDTKSGKLRARLSGYLIGQELAATHSIWNGLPITIISQTELSELYRRALSIAGSQAQMLDGAELALEGLRAAHRANSFDEQ